MAKQRTGKVKDRWKAKGWYRVMAPEMFNNVLIAETMSDAPEKLMGRTVETTMQELTGDISKTHLKLRFQINDVKGSDAHTRFIGYSLASDYIRRLSRKRRSQIDESYSVLTKDGFEVMVKALGLAEKKIQSSQGTAIRNIIKETINESAGSKTLGGFVKEMISGGLSASIFSKCKSIYPLKRVEVRASEILSAPEGISGAVLEEKLETGSVKGEKEEESISQPSEEKREGGKTIF
ncbi:MAG: 30S ribosomal protein S3ae [Thermoplasmatales archaeon]|nr:30S ribosomal protein S3ae [Thermoplasmatales archaeon]